MCVTLGGAGGRVLAITSMLSCIFARTTLYVGFGRLHNLMVVCVLQALPTSRHEMQFIRLWYIADGRRFARRL